MPQPAARMGDMTAHGGTIVQGFPQVLIGGLPVQWLRRGSHRYLMWEARLHWAAQRY
jgi:hypothetical protein